MQIQQEESAINAALEGDWSAAISLNQSILTTYPQHIPTLNRLAKAYAQTGETQKAVDLYQQVLCLDKYNSIASKQCQSLKNGPCVPCQGSNQILTDFIDEPGKTKTTQLVRLGDAKVLNGLGCGQLVNLVIKNHWVAVTTQNGAHIGNIADDLSFQLKQLINNGNQYQAFIKSFSTKHVCLFIKETHRAKASGNNRSFA